MNNIGIFELISGKTFISRYDSLEESGDYILHKPMQIQVMHSPNGQQGVMMSPYVGTTTLRLFAAGIIGLAITELDTNLVSQYIKATTGIELASSVPAGQKVPTRGPLRTG